MAPDELLRQLQMVMQHNAALRQRLQAGTGDETRLRQQLEEARAAHARAITDHAAALREAADTNRERVALMEKARLRVSVRHAGVLTRGRATAVHAA